MRRRNIKRIVLIVLGLALLLLSLQLVNLYVSRKAQKRQDLAYLAQLPEKTFKLYETQMTSINETALLEDAGKYCQEVDIRDRGIFDLGLNNIFENGRVDYCFTVFKRTINMPTDSSSLTKVLDNLAAAIKTQGFSAPTVLSTLEQGYYSYDTVRYEPSDTHTKGGICSVVLLYDIRTTASGPGRLSYSLRCQHHTVGTPPGYTRVPYGSVLK